MSKELLEALKLIEKEHDRVMTNNDGLDVAADMADIAEKAIKEFERKEEANTKRFIEDVFSLRKRLDAKWNPFKAPTEQDEETRRLNAELEGLAKGMLIFNGNKKYDEIMEQFKKMYHEFLMSINGVTERPQWEGLNRYKEGVKK